MDGVLENRLANEEILVSKVKSVDSDSTKTFPLQLVTFTKEERYTDRTVI